MNDLELALTLGNRTDVLMLLGVISATEAAPLFAETLPPRLLPFGIPQVIIVGTLDEGWRTEMTRAYAGAAAQSGDQVRFLTPEGIDHFDVIDPTGPSFARIAQEALALAHGADDPSDKAAQGVRESRPDFP